MWVWFVVDLGFVWLFGLRIGCGCLLMASCVLGYLVVVIWFAVLALWTCLVVVAC